MTGHSKLPPSSAARRMACPGSRSLEALYPREETDAAREGTLAHEVCARLLRGETVLDVPEEMLEHCKLYANHILTAAEGNELHIEERLDISSIHPDCWGTPDCWFKKNNTLYLYDFKYGFGYVDVYENWQLIEYSAGVPVKNSEPFEMVIFTIIQPRWFGSGGSIRKWEVTRDTIQDYWFQLEIAERLAMTEPAATTPSDQCVNCKARHACPALEQTVLSHIDSSSYNVPYDLTDRQIGQELRIMHRAAKLLDARITGLEEEALNLLKRGHSIPHYQVGHTQPRERWKSDDATIIALGDVLGLDVAKPQEPITPKQAVAKAIKEKKDKKIIEILKDNSETPPGSIKLVEINEKENRKIFAK